MDSMSDEYFANTILKSCFPRASHVRMVECEKIENLENASSDIVRLAVEFREDGETRAKKLILKIPYPATRPNRSYCAELGFYRREKEMFELMIPRLHEIPSASKRLPVCYLTHGEGTVVTEDLTAQGYATAGKLKFFDLDESGHIFEAMAEFHAATYKVHRQNPRLLADSVFHRTAPIDARRVFSVTWEPLIRELFRRKNAADRIPKFEAAMELLKHEDRTIYAMLDPARFKFVLLNHGDIRKDNLMLKWNENGQIEDVKFIDFQGCWWSTPAYDFLFYVTFSVPVEVVDRQFDDLVDAYWWRLNEALSRLQCSVDYQKVDFLDDIEKLRFLHTMWLTARCAFTCPLERHQLEAIYQRDDEETFRLCCECLDDERFTRSLWGWLQYCEKLKLFDIMAEEVARRKEPNEGLPDKNDQ